MSRDISVTRSSLTVFLLSCRYLIGSGNTLLAGAPALWREVGVAFALPQRSRLFGAT